MKQSGAQQHILHLKLGKKKNTKFNTPMPTQQAV